MPIKQLTAEENNTTLHDESTEVKAKASPDKGVGGDETNGKKCDSDDQTGYLSEKEEVPLAENKKTHQDHSWNRIRSSLCLIEDMMSRRVKNKTSAESDQDGGSGNPLSSVDVARPAKGGLEDDSEEEFYDVERSDPSQEVPSSDANNAPTYGVARDTDPSESAYPWEEELECLVQGGVPMALRGEVKRKLLRPLILVKLICQNNSNFCFTLAITALASLCGCANT